MVELIIAKFHDPKFLTMVLAAVAAIATVHRRWRCRCCRPTRSATA